MATKAAYIDYDEAAAPATPAAGDVRLYAKTDGLLYSKDDAGAETLVSGGAGGGSVATDAIWDAAGDLAVGSGANTAARLAAGSEGEVLTIASGVPSWEAAGGLPTLLKDRVVLTSASLTVTNTSFEDATGLTITGTTGARRCLVGFTGFVYHGSNQAGVYIQLDIDGTDQGGAYGMTGEVTISGGNDAHNASFTYMTDTLTAASHTFKIQWRVTSGTGNMYASTDVPATFWVAELL